MKLKRGQKYVVKVHKPVSASKVGLGSGRFKKGDFVSYEGPPVKNMTDAHVYVALSKHNDFFKNYEWGEINPGDYFMPIPVKPAKNKVTQNEINNFVAKLDKKISNLEEEMKQARGRNRESLRGAISYCKDIKTKLKRKAFKTAYEMLRDDFWERDRHVPVDVKRFIKKHSGM